jgi:hypothetical protein
MDTIQFDSEGGPLFADIRSGFANPGSYTLTLWKRNSNQKAMKDVEGNFINADDDRHELAGAAADNDGRIVECFVTVTPLGNPKQFFASMRIIQDDAVLGDISVADETTSHTVTVDLFALLEAKQQ